jgi:hypothetical protein
LSPLSEMGDWSLDLKQTCLSILNLSIFYYNVKERWDFCSMAII